MIFEEIEKRLQDKIVRKKPIGGGDINQSFKIETAKRRYYFIKYNESLSAFDMFRSEAEGLSRLNFVDRNNSPEVIDLFEISKGACILLDYVNPTDWTNESYNGLGKKLSAIHKISSARYGYNFDNYLASIQQNNQEYDSFIDFYVNCRIEPLIMLSINRGVISSSYTNWCENVYNRLSTIIPEEQPSLLHGDLWSGNVLNSNNGPLFIDPAVYFGHREIDIAMTKLFGGFGESFYKGYNASYPLIEGWEKRVDLFQLYPLLVHVHLFGGSYTHATKRILDKYS